MLSILIPIYNYNAFALVQELHEQGVRNALEFEIICLDDASSECLFYNQAIAQLKHASYTLLPHNIGRSSIRNLLVSKAKYPWVLFLDCDTFPQRNDFVSEYVRWMNSSTEKAFFGGLLYSDQKPEDTAVLRWVFGTQREALTVAQRQKNPYQSSLISNFAIQRSVFKTLNFDPKIETYGYEDYAFIQQLQAHQIRIKQIQNPVFHLNLETSKLFVSKTRTALKTLLTLSKSSPLVADTKLLKTYKLLHALRITGWVAVLFQKHKLRLESNLTSPKPSLLVFDLYKIGYFCYLNTQ
ncbi:glycosyltransferase family 2 protein [Flavobacterium crassostreae]|uniref:Glycosyltransferase 2-like domain-containing protein n=1 Tax=Flavobacterium crassostreae TaxID=1763534 RepID=A0A1B9E3F3_9FLAO|nr:glycosyltransferase [Flavobacterium crassostreae]OCB76460.1 hypothetical protein LPBF_05845 [Flavobacterium crassostreae]